MEQHEEVETYGDTGITSAHAPIPRWLMWSYLLLPIWGFIWLALYWNGSWGWLDRGFWEQLQKASNTTYPYPNYMEERVDKR